MVSGLVVNFNHPDVRPHRRSFGPGHPIGVGPADIDEAEISVSRADSEDFELAHASARSLHRHSRGSQRAWTVRTHSGAAKPLPDELDIVVTSPSLTVTDAAFRTTLATSVGRLQRVSQASIARPFRL